MLDGSILGVLDVGDSVNSAEPKTLTGDGSGSPPPVALEPEYMIGHIWLIQIFFS